MHYPVYKKDRQVITTSLTPIDLHDIARTCLTYGVSSYCVVTPLPTMQYLARRVVQFWHGGFGRDYNPTRWHAFRVVRVYATLEEVRADLRSRHGLDPVTVATTARKWERAVSFAELRNRLTLPGPPILLIFGTGWGLAEEFIRSCDFVLEPIFGVGPYNHLSVRAAAAVILDRLVADRCAR